MSLTVNLIHFGQKAAILSGDSDVLIGNGAYGEHRLLASYVLRADISLPTKSFTPTAFKSPITAYHGNRVARKHILSIILNQIVIHLQLVLILY